MSSIAIITARGGSKRIPGKNIREFCGKPILAYSIEAAIGSGVFDEVMVSTDSEEISAAAKKYGAKVPFLRSAKTSDDFATTAEVLKEVIEAYERRGRQFELLCCLYPTAPFVTAEKLREAAQTMNRQAADSLIPVVRFSFPPQRAFRICEDKVTYQFPEHATTRSQDLEPLYHDCGQFYMCRVALFQKHGSLLAGKCVPYFMPEEEVQDIDCMSDWIQAELKYKLLSQKGE